MGDSPAAMEALLEWLEGWTISRNAGELYDLARDTGPAAMAEELICRGPWADPDLAGTFTAALEGEHLSLQFAQEDAWERALSVHRLTSSGLLLLALYPQLREVRAWSPDGRAAPG